MNPRRGPLHNDPVQRGKVGGEGVGIVRIDYSADRQRAQRFVIDFHGDRAVAIEFGGDLTERLILEGDLALQPGGDRARIDVSQRSDPITDIELIARIQTHRGLGTVGGGAAPL